MAERSNRGALSSMSMCLLLGVLSFVSMCVSFVPMCVLLGAFPFVSVCVFASKCMLSGAFSFVAMCEFLSTLTKRLAQKVEQRVAADLPKSTNIPAGELRSQIREQGCPTEELPSVLRCGGLRRNA